VRDLLFMSVVSKLKEEKPVFASELERFYLGGEEQQIACEEEPAAFEEFSLFEDGLHKRK